MSVKYENECVHCPKEIGCMGDACPNRNVPHYYCDECGEEIVEHPSYRDYYTTDGADHLCKDCFNNAMVEAGMEDEVID